MATKDVSSSDRALIQSAFSAFTIVQKDKGLQKAKEIDENSHISTITNVNRVAHITIGYIQNEREVIVFLDIAGLRSDGAMSERCLTLLMQEDPFISKTDLLFGAQRVFRESLFNHSPQSLAAQGRALELMQVDPTQTGYSKANDMAIWDVTEKMMKEIIENGDVDAAKAVLNCVDNLHLLGEEGIYSFFNLALAHKKFDFITAGLESPVFHVDKDWFFVNEFGKGGKADEVAKDLRLFFRDCPDNLKPQLAQVIKDSTVWKTGFKKEHLDTFPVELQK